MATPAYIASIVASLMNDTKRRYYTDAAILPYFNTVLDELQEIYQENDIPVIEETSGIITVPAGIFSISLTTVPALPIDLIEIKRLWESDTGQNKWTPLTRREFLPHYMEGTAISKFSVWSGDDDQINLLPSNQINDLKIDYIKRIFNTPIVINQMSTDLGSKLTKAVTYLSRRTAALCAMFIGENETRAAALNELAEPALRRALQIPIKGKQSIITLRRPFRAGYKMRSPY
jgi:hypothetical protein